MIGGPRAPAQTPVVSAAWPPQTQDLLLRLQTERQLAEQVSIPRGRHLVDEGNETASIILQLSGWASVESDSRRGDRVLMDFFCVGDVAGLTDVDGQSHYTITALTDITAIRIERATVLYLLDTEASFRLLCMHALRAQLDRSRNRRLALSAKTGIAKVARVLADLFHRLDAVPGANDSGLLPLSQVLLACAVDLTPVAVNRIVQALRRAGAIEWDTSGVRVLDTQRLQDLT